MIESAAMVERPVTEILLAWNRGEAGALDALIPLVTDELHKIAHAYMRGERVNHTLQPTALINECYLRLIDRDKVTWRDRAHFFAFAARTMRRVLVDHARAHQAKKRGSGLEPVTLDDPLGTTPRMVDLIDVDDALRGLTQLDERLGKLVEVRIFGGLNIHETAEALHISEATVSRDWARARAWLARHLAS